MDEAHTWHTKLWNQEIKCNTHVSRFSILNWHFISKTLEIKIKHQKFTAKTEKKTKSERKPCTGFNESHGKHINEERKPVLTQPEEWCAAQLSCYQPMRMQERERVHDGLRSVWFLVLLSITFGLCSETEQKEDEHLQLTEICIILEDLAAGFEWLTWQEISVVSWNVSCYTSFTLHKIMKI